MSDSLALPFVDEAEDGELDPDQAPSGATVRVPAYAGMAAGDIPACELLPHIGSRIRLSYDDDAAPAPRRTSDVVVVRVDLRERLFPTA